MAKLSKLNPTASAPAVPIEPLPLAPVVPQLIVPIPNAPAGPPMIAPLTAEQRLVTELDPDYPSVIIPGPDHAIGDGSAFYGAGKTKPDFVAKDDEGWR